MRWTAGGDHLQKRLTRDARFGFGCRDAADAGFLQAASQLFNELPILRRFSADDQHTLRLGRPAQDARCSRTGATRAGQILSFQRCPGVIGTQQQQYACHAVVHEKSGYRSARHVAPRYRIANASTDSCVALATSVISPVMRPSCITRIRSLMPSISGSSEEIIRIAFPAFARPLMS